MSDCRWAPCSSGVRRLSRAFRSALSFWPSGPSPTHEMVSQTVRGTRMSVGRVAAEAKLPDAVVVRGSRPIDAAACERALRAAGYEVVEVRP